MARETLNKSAGSYASDFRRLAAPLAEAGSSEPASALDLAIPQNWLASARHRFIQRFPRRGTISVFLIFVGLWAAYCGVGQLLADHFGFLTHDCVAISSRAILATRGDALTLLSLGVPHPLLPTVAALPFAWLGLKNPAIWMSSLLGAITCTWFFVWFRRDVGRMPLLVVPLLMLPLLPGLVYEASGGCSGIAALALMVFAIHLAARFALEQQRRSDLRASGQLIAWTDHAREQAHAIRFLWAAALLLGLACCAQPGLILAMPVFLLVTPLLLPPDERGQRRRVVTIALLLYLPILSIYAAAVVLSAMFDHDFLHAIETSALGPIEGAGHSATGSAINVLAELALTCPVLIYLLARLRNAAVVLLCLIPFLVIWIGMCVGAAPAARAPYTLATVLSILLIFLGARLGRFRHGELALLVCGIVASVVGSWVFLSNSAIPEERALSRLASGETTSLATFADERRLAPSLGRDGILLDEESGGAFITLLNDPTPFILAYQNRWRFALNNPEVRASSVLMRAKPGERDQVAATFDSLGRAKQGAFHQIASAGPWLLLANARIPR